MAKKKSLIIGLAIILIVILAGVVIYLAKIGKIKPLAAGNASITLEPSSGTYSAGQTFDVNIFINTDGEAIAGVDVFYLNYDPGVLEVQDADPNQDGVQIKNGTIFPIYLGERVDSHPGKIAHSGMIQMQQNSPGWTGTGIFATVTFKALVETSSTRLNFDFTPGAENDTNFTSIVGGDILASVGEALFTISGTPTETHTVCNTTTQVCETVPGAGSNECATNAECLPATHTVCNSSTLTCDTIKGEGTNECSSNSECQGEVVTSPPPETGGGGTAHHHVCNLAKKVCVTVNGAGENQCETYSDCLKTPTPPPTSEPSPEPEPSQVETQRPISEVTTPPVETTPTPVASMEESPIPTDYESPEIVASPSPEGILIAGRTVSKPLFIFLLITSAVLLTLIIFFIWSSKKKENEG